VSLVYHGLDFAAFERKERAPSVGPTILSVGRAVPKKGYADLLEALALLPADLDWRFVHIGGGKEKKRLVRRAKRLGIDSRIVWRGALAQPDVIAAYRAADVFVLASRIADDGDRDGLPNVLMEAQSQGLACVATRVSAIPELIEDGITGLLVDSGDPPALARSLERVLRDPGLRRTLGDAGEARVRSAFDHRAGIDAIAGLLTDGHEDRVLRAAQIA
jgi:glycosyltransferase involved in cell wall biosynthesis